MSTPLATSRQVIDRIRWDPALDVTRYTVGIRERDATLRELPLTVFLASAELPWHRVWLVREGARVVWDRARRLDRLMGTGDPAPPEGLPPAPAPVVGGLGPLPDQGTVRARAWRHDGRGWTTAAAEPPAGPPPGELQVATWNVLAGRRGELPEALGPARTAAVVAELAVLDADLIALQEVTPALLTALLAAPWVQRLWSSDGPAADSVRPEGVLLLSRWPLRGPELLLDGPSKRQLVVEVLLPGDALAVAVVHTTSDHGGDRGAVRAAQLQRARRALARRTDGGRPLDALLLGDLNWAGEDPREAAALAGLVDVGARLGATEATYDPAGNALAARLSRTGRRRRFDRILVGAEGGLRPLGGGRFGQAPRPALGDLPPSDHYGVAARLARQPPVTDDTVHTSALAWIPPADAWPAVQAIRRAHDRQVERWMPHVNLLYGFVHETRAPEAARRLAAVLDGWRPFRVRLAAIETFEQRRWRTVWLRPETDPAGELEALQAALQAALPQCSEQNRPTFVPHLSLGQLPHGPEGDALLAAVRADWQPIEVELDAVSLIARAADGPFAVRRRLPLARPPAPSPAPPRSDALRGATQADERLLLAGSRRLGVDGGDTDVVLVGPPGEGPSRLDRLVAALAPEHAREAGSLRRLLLDGELVDVAYLGLPADVDPDTLGPAHLAGLQDPDREVLRGLLEVDLVAEHGRRRLGRDGFVTQLTAVRRWARARRLDAQAWGLPGGIAWAVLVAALGEPDDLPGLFGRMAAVERPVALGPHDGTIGRAGRLSVVGPLPPWRNVAASLTPATARLVRDELARAAAQAPGWDAPVDPRTSPVRLSLTVDGDSPDARITARGALAGRLVGLLRDLEQAGVTPRPYPGDQPIVSDEPWVIGLDRAVGRTCVEGLSLGAVDVVIEGQG